MDVSTGKSDPYVIVKYGPKLSADKLPLFKTPIKYRCVHRSPHVAKAHRGAILIVLDAPVAAGRGAGRPVPTRISPRLSIVRPP